MSLGSRGLFLIVLVQDAEDVGIDQIHLKPAFQLLRLAEPTEGNLL